MFDSLKVVILNSLDGLFFLMRSSCISGKNYSWQNRVTFLLPLVVGEMYSGKVNLGEIM